MSGATRALLLAVAGVAVGLPMLRSVAADPPHSHEVVIEGLKFLPENIVVHRGDVVVWKNKDFFPHTATASGAFDSGPIEAGKSWRFVAAKPGTFAYICSLHTTMKGTLRVE
ncbi:MAG: cupredoxin family copper-binding protein [Pseudomonadota bacterium]|nr:cupredoxin family copper-binding protein [Pseudomonadota bacterium]